RRTLAEREVAFAPAHDLEDDLFDLEADLTLELARGEGAKRDEDLAEPAPVALALLHVPRALEVGLADLAGAQQQRAQGVGVRPDLGEDDGAALERDGAYVMPQRGGDAHQARRPAQAAARDDG